MTHPPLRTRKLLGFSWMLKLLKLANSSIKVMELPWKIWSCAACSLHRTTSDPSMPQKDPSYITACFHASALGRVSILNQLVPMGLFWLMPARYQSSPLALTAQTIPSQLAIHTIIPSTFEKKEVKSSGNDHFTLVHPEPSASPGRSKVPSRYITCHVRLGFW